jgi:hypothetical protein
MDPDPASQPGSRSPARQAHQPQQLRATRQLPPGGAARPRERLPPPDPPLQPPNPLPLLDLRLAPDYLDLEGSETPSPRLRISA